MKKTRILFLFVLCFLLALAGCKHKHDYTEKVVAPTCNESGYTEYTCECGETYKDSYVDALGHTFGEWTVVKEATEDEEGLKERVCACGEKEQQKIAKLEHTHEYSEKVVAPTCEESGYTLHECKCGESYKDSFVDALGHSFGEWKVTKEATEEAEGLKERSCECGFKEEEVIAKIPHVHEYTEKVVAPTCTEKGYTLHTCRCNDSYKDNEVAALGHSFGEWKVVKEATETEEGLKERSCECGEKEEEVIAKIPHTHKYGEWVVVKEATETEEGLKERSCGCGEKEQEVIAKIPHVHSFGEWVVVKEATETEAGLKERSCGCGHKEQVELPKLNAQELVVGPNETYKTIEEALAVAQAGDIIKLTAGTYGAVSIINNGVTIQGPNAGISAVDGERVDEAIFTADLMIEGNNITIDGIKLEGAGRIIGAEAGANDVTIKNVLVTGSTVNAGNNSVTAPFHFDAGEGAEFKNIQIINCKAVDYNCNRPMYFYGREINGITIQGCYFVGNRQNYNDGFKINGDTADFGIKGEVLIQDNYLEGFSQYVVWFRVYSEGSYKIINNTFVNCGQTAGSHAAATFVTYSGAADGKVEIEFAYNTVKQSYMLVRIDAGLPANASVKVNYNKSIENNGTYYIKNASGAKVDALLNYYGETPADKKFMGVESYSPYYNAESEVPAYGSESEVKFSNISYDLDGGEVDGDSKYLEGVEFLLPVPTKEGFVFLGWTLEKGSEDYITSLPATQKGDVTVYANWKTERLSEVTYDFDGGVSEELYLEKGTAYSEIAVDSYSGGFWGLYATSVFIYNKTTDPKPVFSERVYVGRNMHSGLYEVLSVLASGATSVWPEGAEYVIILSASHESYGSLKGSFTSAEIGDIVVLEGDVEQASKEQVLKVKIYKEEPAEKTLTVTVSNGSELLKAYKYGYHFLGWKDAEGKSYASSEDIKGDVTLIAQYEAATLVDKIEITNKVEVLDRYSTLQLEWTIAPDDAFEKTVKFVSSDESIATVDENGLITTYNPGTVTIKIISLSLSGVSDEVTIEVVTPAHFEISYETNSYVNISESVKLNASYFDSKGNIQDIVWSSVTPTIATVDAEGNVTGVAAGKATIRASLKGNAEVYQDFVVTVLSTEQSEALKFVLDSHVSNIFVRYDLGIGAGTPVYYMDIIGSVSKMVFNLPYVVDNQYYETSNNNPATWGEMKSIEFVTVHYTGNMAKGADGSANASYFAGTRDVSIHYATGNDGIFYSLDEKYSGWHASDSGSIDIVGEFKWMDTGVAYTEGEDLLHVEVTASDDGYYEIFGQKTTIKIPEPYDYKERKTNHIVNGDGTYSSREGFGGGKFENRPIESFFNDMGFPIDVVDGKYYMGTTWWCYSNVYEGRICSTGGNYNSVGIESCVDQGSDLWLTWHITAQLVADLLIRYDLDITRVHGHHFYAGKDCPQPMLENNLEIWWEFLELVEAEYEKETTFKDYEFEMVSNSKYIDDKGRVIEQPYESQVVTYTVTIKNGDKVETIELASVLEGKYCK